ncbi:lytic polysaccharide monooxygenase [Kitasatospora sp. NPDC059646]|uniref:lytic polysaccharide monooxygenase auxiliary activity family 9 protein n=1 Tax=Kitasatospora sp. NPDC059646 TaxID=3346893 RepID=UPI00369C1F9B
MPRIRRPLALVAVLACAALASATGPAAAHGSLQNPISRVEGCYQEGAEHPKSAACQAAVATGGTAALYDWMSLRIGDADGRHRELIPDGKLCSAGSDTYKGMDLPRADWPATRLTSGASFTFNFRATAPHKGTFQLFLTNSSYSPTKPLAWSNLDPKPFLTATDPQLVNGSYQLTGTIPAGRTGRQLIYLIWQRSDSPEAFYSCSDVVFDGTGTATVPTAGATPTAAGHTGHGTGPSTSPSTSPSASRSAAAPPSPTASSSPWPVADPGPSLLALAATEDRTVTEPVAHADSTRSIGLIGAVCATFLLAGVAVVLHRRLGRGGGSHR